MKGLVSQGYLYLFRNIMSSPFGIGIGCAANALSCAIPASALILFIVTVIQTWYLLSNEKHLRLNEKNMLIKLIFGVLQISSYLIKAGAEAYMWLNFTENDANKYFVISSIVRMTCLLISVLSDMLVAAYCWWLIGLKA